MRGRYCQLTRYQMLRWIHFLPDIFPVLTKLSKLSQRDSLTIVDLKKLLSVLFTFWRCLKLRMVKRRKLGLSSVMQQMKVGYAGLVRMVTIYVLCVLKEDSLLRSS